MSKDIQQALGYLGDTIHQSTISLCTVHEPHLFNGWQHRTCGECGYILTAMSRPLTAHKKCDISPREPACPAFVERPKEKD